MTEPHAIAALSPGSKELALPAAALAATASEPVLPGSRSEQRSLHSAASSSARPWQDKVVIVTGGSAGLGKALAEAFAAAGARIVVAARNADDLALLASSLQHAGHDAIAVPADVTNDAQVERLIAQTVDHYGRIDVLVNCAGRSTRGAVLDATPEEFQRLFDLNFLGAVRCVRAAAPFLIRSRGHIVNIGSLASKAASLYIGAYPATKFALAGYSQQLRLELGPQGVHVLLVCPGPIKRQGESGPRYKQESAGLPEKAGKPGAGVKLPAIQPKKLAQAILEACRRRNFELIYPRRARILFALAQVSPRLGDWLLRKLS